MTNKIVEDVSAPLEPAARSRTTKINAAPSKGSPYEGKITAQIGKGEDAKNSLIWITIRWSFFVGVLLTVAIYARPIYCQADYAGNLLDDIKSAWGIFMPVITLALGYTFGKGR